MMMLVNAHTTMYARYSANTNSLGKNIATSQWAAEMAERPYNQPTAASYKASQPYNDPGLQCLYATPLLDTCFMMILTSKPTAETLISILRHGLSTSPLQTFC